jgi:hypothetical protein
MRQRVQATRRNLATTARGTFHHVNGALGTKQTRSMMMFLAELMLLNNQ